jgi:glycosyltransferase involved in cell wall biosynthesis
MFILQVFNEYRSRFNGEEAVVKQIDALLRKHGHETYLWTRSSQDIENSLTGKMKAFFSGIYDQASHDEMLKMIDIHQPDVLHVHNVYPLFSPSILVAAKKRNIPVVMSLHNQNLTCPKSDHLYKGKVCERCFGGKEYNCVLRNCRENIIESIGYAARSSLAYQQGWFRNNVTLFLAMTNFAQKRLAKAGYPDDRIVVLPNMVDIPESSCDPSQGDYIAFAGRLSTEKGIETLLAAAKSVPEAQIHLAGNGPIEEQLKAIAPPNIVFRGRLDRQQMLAFYRNARALVLPSICFEMCPLVILEAMAMGLPVIASQTGGLGELVDDGETGFLFERGNSGELAHRLRQLWNGPALCNRMGQKGRIKAIREYSETVFTDRLFSYYEQARTLVGLPAQPAEVNENELVTLQS